MKTVWRWRCSRKFLILGIYGSDYESSHKVKQHVSFVFILQRRFLYNTEDICSQQRTRVAQCCPLSRNYPTSSLVYRSEAFIVTYVINKFLFFFNSKVLSQNPTTVPHPKPVKSNLHFHVLFSRSILILYFHLLWASEVVSPLEVVRPNSCIPCPQL